MVNVGKPPSPSGSSQRWPQPRIPRQRVLGGEQGVTDTQIWSLF